MTNTDIYMGKYEAVVFDFGGVLTDDYSEATYHLEVSEAFGLEDTQLMPFLKTHKLLSSLILGQRTEAEVVRLVTDAFPEANRIEPSGMNSANFYPSKKAIEAVRQFKARSGAKVAIGTNLFPGSRESLRNEGLEKTFDAQYYSCEIGKRKPDLEFYEHIATDLRIDPNRMLFLDDVLANAEGAIAAGYDGIHVTGSSAQTIEVLESL